MSTTRKPILQIAELAKHLTVRILSFCLVGSILYALCKVLYNLFFHPLRSYPGPLLWRGSPWLWDHSIFVANVPHDLHKLHQKYGPQVRVGPNTLSFTEAQAFEDILAHKPGKEEFRKEAFARNPNGVVNILNADKEDHARFRRLMSHAFSEKGLKEQQEHILYHVDLLVDRLKEKALASESTDMVAWYNMITFDIIGDLAFGASFDCLQNGRIHEWIPAVMANVNTAFQITVLARNGLSFFSRYLISSDQQQLRLRNFQYSKEKVDERMAMLDNRGDFWDRIQIKSANDNEGGEGMSSAEMLNNASVLVLGGSETSATTLSGATYFLLNSPKAMEKLKQEIRSTFKSADEIDLFSVSKLKYTWAVLEETMRLYAPVSYFTPRLVPRGGGIVCGKLIPENTSLITSPYAASKSKTNFTRPDEFLPERWLDDASGEFSNDKKSAFIPFALGTRNCIGKNLAYAEMRLVLAKVFWHFELELDSSRTSNWLDQKARSIWAKPPLHVKLSVAQGQL